MRRSYDSGRVRVVAALLALALFAGCGGGSSPPSYALSAREGRSAAQELVDAGSASAVTIALVDADRILWTETVGFADRETGQRASDQTMFGTGSVSKMLTAVAVMKLVDRGVVELDQPLVRYLPSFRMASDAYRDITVRMLLNHSSGFPGTDYRNVEATSAHPGYVEQVLQTLSAARLKAPPGFMSVYCNDCFTVAEALVQATTGKGYAQFVQDEILSPLGMRNTRYTTGAFASGSYAKAYLDGTAQPLEFVNAHGAGGAYSTATDLSRLAMMFLGNGAVGDTRILSGSAVAAMAVDQTVGQFSPARAASYAWGLGWDTVAAPGLTSVGFDGWLKGGDVAHYGAAMLVSPQAGLGVVVIGAPGFGSARAVTLAEQVLLRALVEDGRIAALPAPLAAALPPVAAVPDGLLDRTAGAFASDSVIFRLQAQPDGSLLLLHRDDAGWTPSLPALKHRGDGWFASDEVPLLALKTVDAGGMQYLIKRGPAGHGHYLDDSVIAQRVRGTGAGLSAGWRARLASTWLVANESPDALAWPTMDPRLRLAAVDELPGLIAVRPSGDAGWHVVDPSASDAIATMMLVVPQLAGRDLDDLVIEPRDAAQWARWGGYLYRPLAQVPLLPRGADSVVTLGPAGHAEWRAVASDGAATELAITTAGPWRLFDPGFKTVAHGDGSGRAVLPPGSGLGYLLLFGSAGQTLTVGVR